ncbi:hypothetical protein D3C76_1624550 [compost metagenome]
MADPASKIILIQLKIPIIESTANAICGIAFFNLYTLSSTLALSFLVTKKLFCDIPKVSNITGTTRDGNKIVSYMLVHLVVLIFLDKLLSSLLLK